MKILAQITQCFYHTNQSNPHNHYNRTNTWDIEDLETILIILRNVPKIVASEHKRNQQHVQVYTYAVLQNYNVDSAAARGLASLIIILHAHLKRHKTLWYSSVDNSFSQWYFGIVLRLESARSHHAYWGPSGAQLRHIVPVQQAAETASQHLRRGVGESVKRQIPRALVPREALQRICVPLPEDGRAPWPSAAKSISRIRSTSQGCPREPASGAGRVGGSWRSQLPYRREGGGEGSVQRGATGGPVRRPRSHAHLQPRSSVLQTHRGCQWWAGCSQLVA